MISSSSGFTDKYFLNPTYVLTTPAVAQPITLAQVKQQARLDPTYTGEDTYLSMLIDTATAMAEAYMRIEIINKTFTLYLDGFPAVIGYINELLSVDIGKITLEKSRFQTLNSVKYITNGVLTTVDPSIYYTDRSMIYSSIYVKPDQAWPTDGDNIKQDVQISFVAGFGADQTSVPNDIQLALLQHVTFMYQSRGDSSDGGFLNRIPDMALAIYNKYKIFTMT